MKSFDNLIGPAARAAMREDRRIRGAISRIVPAGALEHVTFCRIDGRQLKVTMDGAAWIPKLRFCERTLLAALIRDGLDVRTVSWHVTPAKTPRGRETVSRVPRPASPQAARALLSVADSLGDDELARQMRRLAGRLVGRRGGDGPADG